MGGGLGTQGRITGRPAAPKDVNRRWNPDLALPGTDNFWMPPCQTPRLPCHRQTRATALSLNTAGRTGPHPLCRLWIRGCRGLLPKTPPGPRVTPSSPLPSPAPPPYPPATARLLQTPGARPRAPCPTSWKPLSLLARCTDPNPNGVPTPAAPFPYGERWPGTVNGPLLNCTQT